MNMYLLGVKNILDKNPELAHDEVKLGVNFLVRIYRRDIDMDVACEKYNTLEELFEGEGIEGFNKDSMRNIMREYREKML